MPEYLFDVDETAKRLGGVSRWSIYCWKNQGRLKATKVGTRVMFRESDVQDFLRRCNEVEARIAARNHENPTPDTQVNPETQKTKRRTRSPRGQQAQ